VHYQFDPIKTLNTSVFGTQQMLELARKTGARFLQFSTSEIYGDPLEHPQKESYWGNVNPLGERACYDEGKRAAETLCKDYHLQFKVDTRIIRIFNVYGPRMLFNDGRVISNFILQALLGQEITVHGDGSQTRSFCYVSDFIEAVVKLMETDISYEPVNIGNPDERSIVSLARLIKEKTRSESQVTYLAYDQVRGRLGDVKQRQADISKLQGIIDWQPKISIEQGLALAIEDFQKRLTHKPHIVVFSPAYLPFKGPAEEAVSEIIKRLPDWEFDIITSRLDKNLPKETHDGSVHIYRVGRGSNLDKYLLPFRAVKVARRLHKKYNYSVAWAIMASYGAIAASLFSMISRHVPFLLSVYEGDINEKMLKKGVWLSPIYSFIFHRAHRWQLIGRMNEQQRAWLEDERNVQVVLFDGNWQNLSKRTKELFQEMEILSTRL
jgi:UDP-glucuronate decarboxylase